jgi:hypothetical protein
VALLGAIAISLFGVGTAQASPQPSVLPASAQVVTLITGDRAVVRPGGGVSVLRAPGNTDAIDSYQAANGDHYVVPASAVPYLSGELDPSLFDVTQLAKTGDLRLTYAEGSTPTAPPGVTLTSVSGGTATGRVSSGPAFAAALRAGTRQLAPGLTKIALAEPPVAAPRYPLHILQINANDLTGKPVASASLFLLNMTNLGEFDNLLAIDNGIAKVAVPAGDYLALVDFADIDSAGNRTTSHDVLAQITVPDNGNATLTVEERAATALIGVSTPKPSTPDLLSTNFVMIDPAGDRNSIELFRPIARPTYISPIQGLKTGTLRYQVEWQAKAADPAAHYRCDVVFGSPDGIPAQQHFTVQPDQIATVHDRISADPALGDTTATLGTGVDSPLFGPQTVGEDTPAPGDLTDYLASTMGNVWAQNDFAVNGPIYFADDKTYLPGHEYTVDWTHGPIAANLGQHTGVQYCIACAAGDTLTLGFNPLGDNDPTHLGQLGFTTPTSAHFTLYRDGATVVDQDGADGAQLTGVPSTPATYRAVFDLNLTGVAGFSQSTVTHTELTVPVDPNASKGSVLPAESSCAGQSASAPCVVLPALNLNYRLATDERNTSTAPMQLLHLSVGHVSYDGAGSRAPITSASVQVSLDNGATWQRVPTVGVGGDYVAFWPNKPGTSPSIKVTATDANGGAITQTVTSAYTAE